jgi:hypothetical protein
MSGKRSKRRGGFGAYDAKHERDFVSGLKALQKSLDSAESYARNGDCYALVDEAERAFKLQGSLDPASVDVRGRHARSWVALGTRLNFLRQSLKRCVNG